MNLLADPVISVSNAERLSLPELLAAMTREEVAQFPALRPHQRPTWHMFLVQLAALALWSAKRTDLPKDSTAWAELLRGLTRDYSDDEPWCMVVDDRAKPAFLQPPAPDGLRWTPVSTPDALDLLITAKNHDLKQSIAHNAAVEDWLFAIVSLQTSAGFDGQKNYGIARMNGGSSSRPLLGLAPTRNKDYRLDPSVWWTRDVQRLLAERQAGHGLGVGHDGGPALLWCLDWPEGQQLDLRELDPWFIEICRRLRLVRKGPALAAVRSNSKASRIDAKVYKGAVGDPWAPVHKTEGKSFTLAERDFDYKTLADLMFGGDWQAPLLAELGSDEKAGNSLLIAEALSRGNSKTDGFKSRVIPVPDSAVDFFRSETAATLSNTQMAEILAFHEALRNAVAVLAARGDWEHAGRAQYAAARPVRDRFDRTADRLFFPHLWKRLEAENSGSPQEVDRTGRDFRRALLSAAKAELAESLPGIPCTAVQRPRAEARAQRAFRARLWKLDAQLFQKEQQEDTDAES